MLQTLVSVTGSALGVGVRTIDESSAGLVRSLVISNSAGQGRLFRSGWSELFMGRLNNRLLDTLGRLLETRLQIQTKKQKDQELYSWSLLRYRF